MTPPPQHHKSDLRHIARRAMIDRGLEPDFDAAALEQLQAIGGPSLETGADVRDLRPLLWCSIDNDDSRDLDQLSVSEDLAAGAVKILVAVADVDGLVPRATPLDLHAAKNTTSVYTAAQVFPMLPERLSTDLTSLNPDADRASLIFEYSVREDGTTEGASVYRALVRNRAKLAYNDVGAWLEGKGPLPPVAARVEGMQAQLVQQDQVAQRLQKVRHQRGALELESLESRPVFDGETLVGLRAEKTNRAKEMIAELMIAANGVVARFLDARKSPSLRRVVRSPERWAKIVGVAAEYGEALPAEPSAAALERFLVKRRAADPLRFPDLSLVIVKLMGRGEYVAEAPGARPVGHFGLALRDYSHSTAPNRRFPDLVTQRLVKAALGGAQRPYSMSDLEGIAAHCTEQEADAAKVERQVRKSAGALLLERRVGQTFAGVITGASDKGTYVRVFEPPVEGRVVRGFEGLRVGDKVQVTLRATDFERGYLDFSA